MRVVQWALASATTLCVTACATAQEEGYPEVLAQNYAVFSESICPAPDGNTPFPPLASVADGPSIPPVQVFDNLYFVGNLVDSAWALTTSDGIILFDAMFAYEVEPNVVEGLKALGLDPADIKDVVVAHGHADHFGGAAFLQEAYGAKVALSETDWAIVEATEPSEQAAIPTRDIVLHDGDTLTLGEATVRFVETPGHTPGTISSIFTVYDHGEAHTAALWGGTAMNFLDADGIRTHMASAERFSAIDPAIDVVLSNHQYADGLLVKVPALEARRPGAPHPFVVGHDGFQDWMEITQTCGEAWLAQRQAER